MSGEGTAVHIVVGTFRRSLEFSPAMLARSGCVFKAEFDIEDAFQSNNVRAGKERLGTGRNERSTTFNLKAAFELSLSR